MPATITAQQLHEALLAADSATAVLEAICGAPVTIRRDTNACRLAPTRLVGAVHRHVALVCGGSRVSDADLWFRPDLLPPAMVAELASSDAPFGRVVKPLGLRRRTLSARVCAAGEPFAVEHHAVLLDRAAREVAEVAERYDWGLVATP